MQVLINNQAHQLPDPATLAGLRRVLLETEGDLEAR